MAIEIKNYVSNSGVLVKNARLVVTELKYHPTTQILDFMVDLFSDQSATPIQSNIVNGNLVIVDATNLEKVVEDAIQFKIDSVVGKTEEECIEHNKSVSSWIDYWDINYLKFISNDTTEDDEYITAAKIMLGEE